MGELNRSRFSAKENEDINIFMMLMEDILVQLKLNNAYLARITDEELTEDDLEDNQ